MFISPRRGVRGSKDWYGWNIIMYKNSKLHSVIPIIWKKASNRSCLELHSLKKSQWTQMSTSLQSEARGLQRLMCLKYCNVEKRESILFTLGLDTDKNKHPKMLQIKVAKNWIPKKKVCGHTCLPPTRVELGSCSKYCYVSNIILYWNGKVDSVWSSTLPKIRIIWEKASNKSCWALNLVQSPHSSTLEGDRCVHPLTFL